MRTLVLNLQNTFPPTHLLNIIFLYNSQRRLVSISNMSLKLIITLLFTFLLTNQAFSNNDWGPVLAKKYANCISKKDAAGNIRLDERGNSICEFDDAGNMLGTSVGGVNIIDSDAVRACASIQGVLPSQYDFEDFTPTHQQIKSKFWSTSASELSDMSDFALYYNEATGVLDEQAAMKRSILASVRCILNR